MTSRAVQAELERLRADVEGLRPTPPAPTGPVSVGHTVSVRFGETCYLTADRLRVVPEGHPEAASLLGRAGIETALDAGWVRWAEAQGVPVERLPA